MSLLEMLDLGEGFKKYFEVIPALTPALKEQAFRIRHSVYCEDLKFEPVRPDGRETDEYDANSLHCLVRNVNNGEFVGCTRLILMRTDEPLYRLPFEKSCEMHSIGRSSIPGAYRATESAKYRDSLYSASIGGVKASKAKSRALPTTATATQSAHGSRISRSRSIWASYPSHCIMASIQFLC